jgi:hypothetical protein
MEAEKTEAVAGSYEVNLTWKESIMKQEMNDESERKQ